MDDKTVFLICEFKKKKKFIWSNPRVVLSLDNNIKFVNWLNPYMDLNKHLYNDMKILIYDAYTWICDLWS